MLVPDGISSFSFNGDTLMRGRNWGQLFPSLKYHDLVRKFSIGARWKIAEWAY